MIKKSLLTAACTMLFLSSGAFFTPGNASANSSYMTACSAQWQSMKQAGTTPAGMKWNDFLKTCDGGAAAQAPTAMQKNPITVSSNSHKPAISAQAPASSNAVTPVQPAGGQIFMQACGAKWAAMKNAGTIPAGMKWTSFLKTCSPSATSTQAGAQTSSQPAFQQTTPQTARYRPGNNKTASAPITTNAPAANGAASQGQLAEQSRIKECGSEWKAAKTVNTVPAGQAWPQFWSSCDARLKANNG